MLVKGGLTHTGHFILDSDDWVTAGLEFLQLFNSNSCAWQAESHLCEVMVCKYNNIEE